MYRQAVLPLPRLLCRALRGSFTNNAWACTALCSRVRTEDRRRAATCVTCHVAVHKQSFIGPGYLRACTLPCVSGDRRRTRGWRAGHVCRNADQQQNCARPAKHVHALWARKQTCQHSWACFCGRTNWVSIKSVGVSAAACKLNEMAFQLALRRPCCAPDMTNLY